MCTGIFKWITDSRTLDTINSVYLKLNFNVLYKISDTHSRMLFSLFSHNFVTTNMSYNLFEIIFEKIDNAKKKKNRIVFDKKIV